MQTINYNYTILPRLFTMPTQGQKLGKYFNSYLFIMQRTDHEEKFQ